MNTSTKILALTFAIAFSGSAFSGAYTDQQKEDILYGQGVNSSAPAQSHSGITSRPQELSEDIYHNVDEVNNSSAAEPYQRLENDRDNSQSLIFS